MGKLNWILLILFAATLALNWGIARDVTRLNVEFMPDMVHSAAYESFESNPHFADGKTLREPVAGTIPRGFRPLHYGATPEERIRAGREMKNPFLPAEREALNRGAVVYQNVCVPCHGASGRGDGPVSKKGFPPPASLVADKAIQLQDGEIFHIVTYGQNNMPAYAAQLDPEDRWKVVLHVRSLQSASQRRPQ